MGSDAIHMNTRRIDPEAAAIRMPTPATRAAPMATRPIMKSQSAQVAPASEWNESANGPCTLLRKPVVGEPPFSHELADGVALPQPRSLSKNAHRKTKPMPIRAAAHT